MQRQGRRERPGGSIRAFLAVELPRELRARLAALQRELARHGAAVRWVADDNLHVTVKFLGSVAETALNDLHQALSGALDGTPPLAAAVRGLGAFPDLRRARIIWAGVACAPLAAVAAAVDLGAAPIGVAPETRPFHAHVTLGRVHDARRWAPLAQALSARATEHFGSCVFAELVAYRSDLRPDGALYTKLWSIPFGG